MAKIPKTMFITRNEAIIILAKYKSGRIFTVTFVKRTNGQTRVMNCRKGVRKGVSGQGMAYDPKRRNLVPVYDMKLAAALKKKGDTDTKAFRMIAIEGITEMTIKGVLYVVK